MIQFFVAFLKREKVTRKVTDDVDFVIVAYMFSNHSKPVLFNMYYKEIFKVEIFQGR